MLLTQGSISEEEKSVLAKVGEYPAIQTLDDEIHTLYGEKTYVLPKLDGVNLRIVHLNQNRYALLTRQGYVADEFIKPINQLLPQKIFELADKYTVVLELESILIPTTSKSLCNYNVIDLFDEKRVAMIPLAERNKLCKQYDLNYPEVISTVTLNAQNGKNTKRATMALILKQSLEGLIFETESKGMSYKLRYKNNKYESKIAKTEQEYSKLFLEMGYAFLEFESVCPKIKSRLTREFGVQPSIEFIKNTHTEYSKKIVSGATCLVDHYSNNFKSFPLSILIGGNNGTGKTMIARKLAICLK